MKVRKNLEEKTKNSKLARIFGCSPEELERELMADQPQGSETYQVDEKHACKRWFSGDINIVIYQVEGSGGDILKQQHKMSLKDFKTTVSAHIPLQGRVKRTMQNRRRDLDQYPSFGVGE